MKLLILILLTLPQLIFAGWVKEGNGFISEDSLVGQKRFLPEENAVIVESKDYVLKFDLTTGEIIKRIDIVETDTTYKNAVANDDLSQVYLQYQTATEELIHVTIKSYFDKQIVHEYKRPGLVLERSPRTNEVNTVLFYINNYFIISGQTFLDQHISYEATQFSNISENNKLRDTLEDISKGLYFASYADYYPGQNIALFRKYNVFASTYHNIYSIVYNEISTFEIADTLEFRYLKSNNESNQRFRNVALGKDTNLMIFESDKFYLSNIKVTNLINLNSNSSNRFTKYDNYFLNAYDQGGKLNISIMDLEGIKLFTDTLNNFKDSEILFNDGETFYFQANDKIVRYSPEFLDANNLRAIMSELKDTMIVGEEFTVKSLSSGNPYEIVWELDDKKISGASKLISTIGVTGKHQLKLIVRNEINSDSIIKQIFIRKIERKAEKLLDFSSNIEYISPLRAEFKVTIGDDFKEYNWNFGDGKTAIGKAVKHTYLDSGNYTVTLTAFREDGSYEQEIKFDLLNGQKQINDYTSPLFDSFELKDEAFIYFKPLRTIFDIKLKVIDLNGYILFDEYFEILSKGEIYRFNTPIENQFKFILEDKGGVVYEY